MKTEQTITVVGAGALGSHFVELSRNFLSSIKVIDFDHVEKKNVASQFHSKTALGKNKAAALQQLMLFCFGNKINVISNKLVEGNVTELLSNSKLVVDCLDNAEARVLVQKYVRQHNIPCLHGGLAVNGEFGRVMWDELFTIDEAVSGAPTCENGDHLAFINLNASVLTLAAQEFLNSGKKHSYLIFPDGSVKKVS